MAILNSTQNESGEVPEEVVHEIASTSHIGSTHVKNQDAVAAVTWNNLAGQTTLLAVADGVSSGAHSEIASRMAVDGLLERVSQLAREHAAPNEMTRQLIEAAEAASHMIAQRPHQDAVSADATTLAAALCLGSRVAGLWIGDSRVYLLRNKQMSRLTRDHSWSEAVVSRGLMTEEAAQSDPRARMITRWLGPQERAQPGLETFELELEHGNVVMCCSDGLYMYFSSPFGSVGEMGEILSNCSGLQSGVEELQRLALDRGGHDDISIAALRLTS